MKLLSESELDRYEAFRRSSVKKAIQGIMQVVTGVYPKPQDKALVALSSVAKSMVGELVETGASGKGERRRMCRGGPRPMGRAGLLLLRWLFRMSTCPYLLCPVQHECWPHNVGTLGRWNRGTYTPRIRNCVWKGVWRQPNPRKGADCCSCWAKPRTSLRMGVATSD